ncbi:MAG TPA: Gfo/Idh/MocA family oxidoreductase [Candidatus Acidoferrum sp.]|nr:Gfo/Idh/MocA family oxidoreductase [Candidatus Acidoferrum sp.]
MQAQDTSRSGASDLNRRRFLQQFTIAAAGTALVGCRTTHRRLSANDKLNIGFIGTAGQAEFSLESLKDHNCVALCDVDSTKLAAAAAKHPGAKVCEDFRRLIDQKNIDAIVIATPDHTHAVATAAALRSGRDVYCEKPLTHTVSEARIITELARKHKAVTQLGTQIHAGGNYRRVVELIRADAIGQVKEVHVWVNSSYGGKDRPTETPPVPKNLNWELWLGPIAPWPYHPNYAPFAWRNWWHFGGGSLADFGCHYMDLPFWALGLKYPVSVEPVDGPTVHPDAPPQWLIMRFEFLRDETDARGAGRVPLTWYHGGRRPEQLLPEELKPHWKSGVLFVGEKGMLLADYRQRLLLPEEKFKDFVAPQPSISNSIGHHKEWVEAIKTRGTTTCHFGYSGPLTETALLGNVAYRVQQKLEWDAKKLHATNCPEAEALIQHHYRTGWKV